MSERSDELLIRDILFCFDKIQIYLVQSTKEQFYTDIKTQDAVSRNFEVIGESTSRLSSDFKNNYNLINWRIVKDFRNKLIHDYFGIDYETVWIISQEELPILKEKLKLILQEFNQSPIE